MAITLKELINRPDVVALNLSDLEIIKLYFTINSKEEEGLTLISSLASHKINSLSLQLGSIQSWDLVLHELKASEVSDHKQETADNLSLLQRVGLLNKSLKDFPNLYSWAKKVIPTLTVPQIYFQPTFHYLASYDIYFKDFPKEKVADCINYEDSSVRELKE